jgi:hypothetical protein
MAPDSQIVRPVLGSCMAVHVRKAPRVLPVVGNASYRARVRLDSPTRTLAS